MKLKSLALLLCAILVISGCQSNIDPMSVEPSRTVSVGSPFSDNMVLQRNIPVSVWGMADPDKRVTVEFHGQKYATIANTKGAWSVKLSAMPASSTPSKMTISGQKIININNILVGDIWVGSGQSNMWWPVNKCTGAKKTIASSANPNIRLLSYNNKPMEHPIAKRSSSWKVCAPNTVSGFSGVLYYFGKNIQKKTKVPVGLIHSSVGGTNIERWISREGYQADPAYADIIETVDHARIDYKGAYEKYNEKIRKWLKNNIGDYRAEQGVAKGWNKAGFDDKDWKTMPLPGTWERYLINLDGSIWFRKQFKLPAEWVGKTLTLSLGKIDDYDTSFCNGVKIGETNTNTMNPWLAKRIYKIPAKLVNKQKITLAVQVFDIHGGGGIRGGTKDFYLALGKDKIPLKGVWKYKVEKTHTVKAVDPVPYPPTAAKRGPASLYNGMINPLIKFPIRGILWYQGESNTSRPIAYRRLQKTLIRDWRQKWNQGDFPFLIVQLASFDSHRPQNPLPKPITMPDPNTVCNWALLREAQMMALVEPNTGVAVSIDIGDRNDIHPANKADVGHRLALIAEKISYGKDVVYSGPVYEHMKIEGNKIRLFFKHQGGGLVARSGSLKWFAIAGGDGQFFWANAEIDGNTLVVSSPQVENPVAVRYAWARNPEGCNLYNKAGLPASPFRTSAPDGLRFKKLNDK